MDSTKRYETGSTRFQDAVKKTAFGQRNRVYEAPFSLEIDAEHKPRLVAFEICQIEGSTGSG
jgi:hypothetical protein